MATSKQNLYSTEDQFISFQAKAISHPARVKILKTLRVKGPCCVQIIAQAHPISKEALSDHLAILREAQLVTWYERFPFTFYSNHTINIRKAKKALEQFFDEINTDL